MAGFLQCGSTHHLNANCCAQSRLRLRLMLRLTERPLLRLRLNDSFFNGDSDRPRDDLPTKANVRANENCDWHCVRAICLLRRLHLLTERERDLDADRRRGE